MHVVPPPPVPTYQHPQRWWILAACCLVGFAQLAQPRLLVIALDLPVAAFGLGQGQYELLANLGVVLFVASQLLGGVTGDLFGRRRVFLIGASGFTLSSLLILVAPNLLTLVSLRAVLGIMGALVFPLTLGLIRIFFNERERSNALLIYTLATALGTLASLALLPIEARFGWRWSLLLPISAGIIGVRLAWRFLPESYAEGGINRREAIAVTAWTLFFLLTIFGLIVARISRDWLNPITLSAGVIGIIGLLVLTFWPQQRLHPGLFRRTKEPPRHLLSMLILVSATLSFALSGYALQLFSFFTKVWQLSALLGGIALAPILVVTVISVRWVASFAYRRSGRVVVASGLLAMGIAIGLTALARPNIPYLLMAPLMMLFGLGFLLASTAWSNVFLSALPPDLVGVSSGINKAAGLVGGALATVILSSVVRQAGLSDFARRIAAQGLSAEQQIRALEALNTLLDYGVNLSEDDPQLFIQLTLLATYRESYSVGISAALATAAVLCLLTCALAWFWLRPADEEPG